jgi:acetyl esterase/lipase
VNSEFDWITPDMALRWADWFCSPAQRGDPLVSPVNADLTRLPPIYIQAGGSEILLPGIQEFVSRAKQQGADVSLEIWPEMNHDFQAFGYDVPQSAEAIQRIGEVIATRLAQTNGRPAAVGS